MSNLSKLTIRRTTATLLTLLLVIAIAAPLLSFATAAGVPTASLNKSSGPNGTVIGVSGTGFGVSEAYTDISVSVDGHAAGLNVIMTTTSASPGVNPAVTLSSGRLATSASGVLSGSIILYGLAIGSHTVMISDSTTSVLAGTFTITAPSVTVTPSTVTAGSSVIVSGSGFPTAPGTYTNTIGAASFAGTAIAVASGVTTATVTTLSSNTITSGASTGTVSLPAITTGSAFTLTDAWGNVATTTLSLGTPIVTLTPSSGPVGTVVTATLAGFGPSATIATVQVGNIVASTSTATVSPTATVTEQGTSTFVFTMPAGTTTTQAGVAGAQTVVVTDSLGNAATATFTVTPKVMLALGAGNVTSTTTIAPASTALAQIFVTANGFKASSQLTITASPFIPAAWINPSATWAVSTGTYSAITGKISTDAAGVVTFVSDGATTPAAAGQYSITISDGTTSVSTIITITTTGNIISASNAAGTSSGAIGSGVTVAYFGASAPATILFDSSVVATPSGAVQAWPNVTTNTVAFNVPSTGSGLHQIASSTTGFNSVPFTVLAPTITVVSPASASVGTTVTVVGTGFSATPAVLSIQGATVAAATSNLVADTLIATFAVPNYIPGAYTLTLSDGVNTASTTLNVAAAEIQITPTTSTLGTVASPVTIAITGSGFKAGEAITVTFDSTTITATTPVGLTVINSNGAMLINSGFVIPTAAAQGAHTVTVIGAAGSWATATFTIQPKLNALTAVRPGAQIIITGNGFAANSLQTLYVDGVMTNWLNTGVTPATTITQSLVVTNATGNLYTTSSVGFVVPTTQAPGSINVTVMDAAGNALSTTLIVLGTPAITLGSANIVAGTIATGVSISGTGFTPGARSISANLYQGSTLITTVTLSSSSVTVTSTGTFSGRTFTLPASVQPGAYTLRFTATSPTETADAAINVLGTPTMVAPTTAVSGSNVTITVNGLTAISTATFGGVDLVASSLFGSQTVSASGTGAFTKTTWFIVPTTLFAGTYLLILIDSNTGLVVQSAITVTPTMALDHTTGIKGTSVGIFGTGFAASRTVNATINGAPLVLGTTVTMSNGTLSTSFMVPITATATNTIIVMDAAGNTASATFTLTNPTITLDPTTAATGATVQILGSGFTVGSSIVIQVGGSLVTTTPAALTATGGAFIAYISVPTGLLGNVTVTATDSSNNVATAYLTVGASTGTGVPSQTTMTSTAQTTTPSGTATTTFAAGSTVKAGFMLQSTSGSRTVVVAVTWQQGAKVYNMASFQTTMTTVASPVSFSNTLPAGITGTWTATLQVFASDGVTPLGVTTLTFTVS